MISASSAWWYSASTVSIANTALFLCMLELLLVKEEADITEELTDPIGFNGRSGRALLVSAAVGAPDLL